MNSVKAVKKLIILKECLEDTSGKEAVREKNPKDAQMSVDVA